MESDLRPRETQRWFVPPKPRTAARVRLFCFPSAGGDAHWFSDWPRLLPAEIEVVAAGLAEQGTRRADRPPGDFPTLIHSLAEAIRPLLDLPFALFGHGMGALVAFELARALRRQRQPTPFHLFLSAHPAPHDPGNRRPMATLSDTEAIAELRKWGATPEETPYSQAQWESLLPAFRADCTLWETYCYREAALLDCPISAWGSLTNDDVGIERLDGWRRQTSGPLFLHVLSADHLCLRRPKLLLDDVVRDLSLPGAESSGGPLGRPPVLVPPLSPQEFHLWRIDLDRPPAAIDILAVFLSTAERRRAARFVRDTDRQRFIVGHAALRTILGQYLGIPPGQVEMIDGPGGKPSLPPPNMSHLHYNLSHSESVAMVALALDREVGVDVEHVRYFADAASIVQRYFAPGERARWQAMPDHEQRAAFFRAWTRKEAYLKARGIGLSAGLDQFEVSLVPGEPTRLVPDVGTADSPVPWHVYDVSPGNGYLAACAVEGGIEKASVYDWPLFPLPPGEG